MYNAMVRMRNKKGFTLMEMLIVVAIIAILVAISIPVFTSQLSNAKTQTDAANERAAKAVAVATYLTDGTYGTRYYDANNGILVTNGTSLAAYGKATGHTTSIIKIVIDDDGTTEITWVTPASAT